MPYHVTLGHPVWWIDTVLLEVCLCWRLFWFWLSLFFRKLYLAPVLVCAHVSCGRTWLRRLMSPREVICCTSSADCSKSCMSGRGGIVTSPSEQPRLRFCFLNVAAQLWCVAVVGWVSNSVLLVIYIYIYIIVFWHQTMYPLYVRITLEPLFAKVVQIHVLFF